MEYDVPFIVAKSTSKIALRAIKKVKDFNKILAQVK